MRRAATGGVILLDHDGRCVMLHNNNLTVPYLQIPYSKKLLIMVLV